MSRDKTDNMAKKLTELLGSKSDVVLAFLFGSYQRGELIFFSDLEEPY
jgi:predicted nucleotidyltransferase